MSLGMNNQDVDDFVDMLVKANTYQLEEMLISITTELRRRSKRGELFATILSENELFNLNVRLKSTSSVEVGEDKEGKYKLRKLKVYAENKELVEDFSKLFANFKALLEEQNK